MTKHMTLIYMKPWKQLEEQLLNYIIPSAIKLNYDTSIVMSNLVASMVTYTPQKVLNQIPLKYIPSKRSNPSTKQGLHLFLEMVNLISI